MANIDKIIESISKKCYNSNNVITKGKSIATFVSPISKRTADVNFNNNNEVTMIILYYNSYNPYIRDTKTIVCNEETTDDEVYKTITEYLY